MNIKTQIDNARKALDDIKDYTQEQIDQLVYAGAKIIYDNAVPLARLAIDETGLGKFEHKIAKNIDTAAVFWDYLKDKKSIGVINEISQEGLFEVAHPIGVIGAITPATNPTVTPLGNFMHAVKGKNAIIISPAPRAEKTSTDTVNLIRQALVCHGAPADLIQVVECATIEKSTELMELCDLILATGGTGLTKAAYSSGTPAYGVGPGNPPVILDRGFDLEEAAKITLAAVGSDNGILCDGDNLFLYPQETEASLFEELKKVGIVIYEKPEDVARFREALFHNGKIDAALVGKDANIIAKAAGFDISDKTEVIGLKIEGVGKDDILGKEIMGPIVVLKSYETFEEAVDLSVRNMMEAGGIGHTAGILTNNKEHILYAGEKIPVARLLVNQPTPDAWGPATNGLTPAVSEGCGSWGNNILAGNVDYIHLINVSKIAMPLTIKAVDAEEIFK